MNLIITSKLKNMWIDMQVSFYSSHQDITGKAQTLRQILNSEKNFSTITAIRNLQWDYDLGLFNDADYKKKKTELKNKLPCFSPAALLKTRAAGNIIEINRTGIMQLDFDFVDIQGYNIEELKQAVFKLPFIGLCSLSCSGNGFYALALIAEPGRLKEYAEHCFQALSEYGMIADKSKGRNVNDLRYVSFDEKQLIREDPEPLRISYFKTPVTPKPTYSGIAKQNDLSGSHALVDRQLFILRSVQIGHRWETVQHVAYTLGGLSNAALLDSIKQVINSTDVFSGEEKKYIKCAKDCFKAGSQNPLQKSALEDFNNLD